MVSPCRPIPCRYIFATLACFGMIVCYMMKVSIGMAIVSMVNHTAIRLNDRNDNDTAVEDGPMIWSLQKQGTIISSYFWGYIVGQYPGGRLSEVFSAKWMFYIGGSVNIIGQLLIPVSAYVHFSLVIVVRVLQGVTAGFTFPACHVLVSRWAPPSERNVISSFIYNGSSIGTVVSMLLTGTIAARINWEASFYILGGACLPWMIAWPFLIYDRPKVHPLIKEKELNYLTKTLGDRDTKKLPVPWKSLAKSIPFYMLIIAHLTTAWTWYMVLTGLPSFLHMVFEFTIQENAILTATPFFTMWLLSMTYGKLVDYLIAKKKMSTTWVRKMSTIISTVIPIVCLMAMCYIGEQRAIGVTLMIIAVTSIGVIFSGFVLNHIDLASNFAGTLMGITNTIATLAGIAVPLFVGWLTDADPTINSWRIIFWITIALSGIQLITFTLFGTAKEQKWNNPDSKKTEGEPIQQ